MPAIYFSGQDKKFQFNYRMLRSFAQHFPTDKKYSDLAKGLISLGISSITCEILNREVLKRSDLDALWATGTLRLRSQLLDDEGFFCSITDKQAQDILASGDSRMFFTAARLIHLFWKPETPEGKRRISRQMEDALLEGIKNFPDPIVNKLITSECVRPASFIFPSGGYPSNSGGRFAELTEDDVKLLPYLPVATVADLADDFGTVADFSVRTMLIEHLLGHEDPSVRLNLSTSEILPDWALEKLAHDPEPDVADAAQKTLGDDDIPAYIKESDNE